MDWKFLALLFLFAIVYPLPLTILMFVRRHRLKNKKPKGD